MLMVLSAVECAAALGFVLAIYRRDSSVAAEQMATESTQRRNNLKRNYERRMKADAAKPRFIAPT